MSESFRSQPTHAAVAAMNAAALLKRRFGVEEPAPGMDASGQPLLGDDRQLRIEFDEAVSKGTSTPELARRFFDELVRQGSIAPVATLLVNSSLFASAMAALPEARQACANALLGPAVSRSAGTPALGHSE